MSDKYRNFKALQAEQREGRDFRVQVNFRKESKIAIVAPHGGAIEPGTSELAIDIAGKELNFAVFEGIKSKQNRDLHITSTNFDEPRCVYIVEKTPTTLTVHGESSSGEVVYIGGLNQSVITHISLSLEQSGFTVKKNQNPDLQGISSDNICNRGIEQMGIQLELSRGLREKFFSSLSNDGRKITTCEFKKFVDAIRQGLKQACLL